MLNMIMKRQDLELLSLLIAFFSFKVHLKAFNLVWHISHVMEASIT